MSPIDQAFEDAGRMVILFLAAIVGLILWSLT